MLCEIYQSKSAQHDGLSERKSMFRSLTMVPKSVTSRDRSLPRDETALLTRIPLPLVVSHLLSFPE